MAPPKVKVMKKTLGRQKIEMKKIEKKSSLQVTFSKRRAGLFKKASELSILCGAQVAILATSPAGKIFSFGHPSVDAVVNSFLAADAPDPVTTTIVESTDQYEEVCTRLNAEKTSQSCWWNEPYDGLEVHELECYLKALESLAENVSKRADEMLQMEASSSSTNSTLWDDLIDIHHLFDRF